MILAVVLANAVIGFIQEGRAEAAMAAIRQMLAPRSAVLQDGVRTTIDEHVVRSLDADDRDAAALAGLGLLERKPDQIVRRASLHHCKIII